MTDKGNIFFQKEEAKGNINGAVIITLKEVGAQKETLQLQKNHHGEKRNQQEHFWKKTVLSNKLEPQGTLLKQ